jgi:hypothetical protein
MRHRDQRLVLPKYSKRGRKKGWNDEQRFRFKEHLKTYEREGSHYTVKAQSEHRFFTDDTLTAPKVWKDYCEKYDPQFYQQAVGLNYWKGYDKKWKKKPTGRARGRPKGS